MVNPTSHLASLDFLSTWKRNISDLITGNGEAEAPDAAEVQNKYNDQRNTVRRNAHDLGFDGDYRAKAVNGTDEFDKPSLATLRAKVDKIDIDAVNNLVDAWKQVATRNSTSLDEFRTQISRGTSPDVWSGAAASAAAATVAGYDATGKKVTAAAALTGSKLDELRTGLEPTKNLVPYPPEHRSGGDNLHSFLVGRGWRNDDVAQWNAKVEAVRVLETVYAPVIHESDTNVPVIPIPKTVENNGGDPGTTGGATQPNSGGPSSTTPGTTQPATTTPSTTDDTTTDDSTTDDSTDDTTAGDESTTPESTAPQSTDPAATTPAGTTPGSGTPSGSPGGSGGPGGGTPGAGTPSPGSSVPGSPSTTGNLAAGRAVGAGTGATGRSGMPGMMSPGGKGGGKDDESTKGIPDYLITQEHGDELTGLGDLPKNVPPVIGAE